MKLTFARWRDGLFEPVAGYSLALFRILFGIIMASEMVIALVNGKIRYCYVEPAYYFPYFCTPFVTPLPAPLMYAVCILIVLSAACIAAGLCFRAGAIVFALLYTYVFLIDKTMYNNHYYLICLLSLLLAISSAGRCWSVDNLIRSSDNWRIPAWNLLILRFQIALVFFYGGVAKLNFDWLNGEPMRAWLEARNHYPLVGPYWNSELGVLFFSYGGLLFDLLAPVLLLSGTTFWLTVPLYVFFNVTNAWLFTIGSFPPLMLSALLLFLPPQTPRVWWQYFKTRLRPPYERHPADAVSKHDAGWTATRPRYMLIILGLAVYALIQILAPLRQFLYSGNVSWTEEGHTFSWHMKLREKAGTVKFFVTDAKTGQIVVPDPLSDIRLHQTTKLPTNPDLIWQYAQHLARKARSLGAADPVVTVETSVSLNGRPSQDLIKPDVDLGRCHKDILRHSSWITELRSRCPNVHPGLLALAAWLTTTFASVCALLQVFAGRQINLTAPSALKGKIDILCLLAISIVFAMTRISSGLDPVLCYGATVIAGGLLSSLRFVEYQSRDPWEAAARLPALRFFSIYLVTVSAAVSLVLAYGRGQF